MVIQMYSGGSPQKNLLDELHKNTLTCTKGYFFC
jgi:hypothetical protein